MKLFYIYMENRSSGGGYYNYVFAQDSGDARALMSGEETGACNVSSSKEIEIRRGVLVDEEVIGPPFEDPNREEGSSTQAPSDADSCSKETRKERIERLEKSLGNLFSYDREVVRTFAPEDQTFDSVVEAFADEEEAREKVAAERDILAQRVRELEELVEFGCENPPDDCDCPGCAHARATWKGDACPTKKTS